MIHFDLSNGQYDDPNGLQDVLNSILESCISNYGLKGKYRIIGTTLPVRFGNILEMFYKKQADGSSRSLMNMTPAA